MNIVNPSVYQELKESIEKLPSVKSFKFKAGNGESASVTDYICRVYLRNEKLVEDKDALYEVPEFLNKKGINASLDYIGEETFWEFVV